MRRVSRRFTRPTSFTIPPNWNRNLLLYRRGLVSRPSNAFGGVAGVVYEDNDIEAITRLCELDRDYGAQRIEEAARVVAQKRPDNPLRSMAYLIGIVRNGPSPVHK
jgi:hypothetical protein